MRLTTNQCSKLTQWTEAWLTSQTNRKNWAQNYIVHMCQVGGILGRQTTWNFRDTCSRASTYKPIFQASPSDWSIHTGTFINIFPEAHWYNTEVYQVVWWPFQLWLLMSCSTQVQIALHYQAGTRKKWFQLKSNQLLTLFLHYLSCSG